MNSSVFESKKNASHENNNKHREMLGNKEMNKILFNNIFKTNKNVDTGIG